MHVPCEQIVEIMAIMPAEVSWCRKIQILRGSVETKEKPVTVATPQVTGCSVSVVEKAYMWKCLLVWVVYHAVGIRGNLFMHGIEPLIQVRITGMRCFHGPNWNRVETTPNWQCGGQVLGRTQHVFSFPYSTSILDLILSVRWLMQHCVNVSVRLIKMAACSSYWAEKMKLTTTTWSSSEEDLEA